MQNAQPDDLKMSLQDSLSLELTWELPAFLALHARTVHILIIYCKYMWIKRLIKKIILVEVNSVHLIDKTSNAYGVICLMT